MSKYELFLNTLIKDEDFIMLVYANDRSKWEKWISENQDKKEIAKKAKRCILAMQFKQEFPSKQKIEQLKNKVEDSILLLENQRDINVWSPWLKRVAVLFFAVSIVAALYFILNDTNSIPNSDVAVNLVEKSTHKGQKLSTYLLDGSKVTLNSQSKISYELPFTDGERIVYLEGEAFFEVVKNPDRPFKVVAKGVTTTALGTSFNIKTSAKEVVEVSLVTGVVEVENQNKDMVLLEPGHMATTTKSEKIIMESFDYLQNIAWKDGKLVFNNATFSDIFNQLESWYGVTIKVNGKIQEGFHYSASYENLTLADVLEGITFVKPFKFSIKGDFVEISF